MLLILGILLSSCGGSSPTTISANLGPMPTDVPELSNGVFGFQRAGPVLHRGSKVVFVVFDTLWDMGSTLDRWAEVKALSQFGTWSGLMEGQATAHAFPITQFTAGRNPFTPTPDLSHATYRSRYVAFVHHVMQSKQNGPPSRLPPAQEVLLARYGHLREQLYPENNTLWPVILVGGYAMHGQVVTSPMSVAAPSLTASQSKLFAWFQKEIAYGGKDPEQEFWVTPLNDFASTMVAIICHADGQEPANACNRPVIHAIEHRLP